MKIHLVVGLPASGKTHYLKSYSDDWTVIDDPKDISEICDHIGNIVIADPFFCNPNVLEKAINIIKTKYGIVPVVFYYDNNPTQCLKNASNRDRRVDGLIRYLSKIYNPPKIDFGVYGATFVVNKYKHVPTDNDVYIGRGSRWGNPFVIGKHGNREEVIQKYIEWFQENGMKEHIGELVGKTLVCYCKPQLCHGDYLKMLCEEIG